MRTMLLSFKPEWYNRIKEGSKIFEYRRTFPDEEILAYMYVSNPMKMIVGKIHLGRKIDINTWKEEYKEDAQVCERIDDFLTRHTYVSFTQFFIVATVSGKCCLRQWRHRDGILH